MVKQETCRHVGTGGKRCRSPIALVDGLCAMHDPGRADLMAEARSRGGKAVAAKHRAKGLSQEALGPLETPQDAARWLELIASGVTDGCLGHHEASAATRALREWLRAHEAGSMAEDIQRLREGLEEFRKTGDTRKALEVLK